MSKTKAGGSTRNGRDSESKRLGTKVFDGQKSLLVPSLLGKEEQKFIQEILSKKGEMILFMPK